MSVATDADTLTDVPGLTVGQARTIYPVHTMRDGDTVFALSTDTAASVETDVVGAWAAEVLATAVLRAVRAAHGVGGLPAYRDLFG